MPSAFTDTMRSLDATSFREASPRLGLGLLLLVGWSLWAAFARVSVYATTATGRLEVSEMAHRAAAAERGRIVEVHLELGRSVAQGEVLVQLDASVEQHRLDEAEARVRALGPVIDALYRQI